VSAAALSACTRTVSEVDLQKAEISLAEVRAVVDSAPRDRRDLLIDPRPVEDYEKGRIPGARRLDLSAVSGIDGQTDPHLKRYRSLIVYGNDPATASARAMAKKLMATGYARVRYFVGGLGEWTRAGYPVETGPATGADAGGR
jgi:rhodanese-related sulfurtransferase